MLRTFFLFTILLCCVDCFAQFPATAKQPLYPVSIDGDSREWETPFGLYDAKTQLMFSIANNDSCLYLCFQCPDANNQDKITRAGMKVSIIRKGKNKLNASIVFPLKKEERKKKNEDEYVEEQSATPLTKEGFLLNNVIMHTEGFSSENGNFPVNKNAGIQVAINWDSTNTMVYEIAMPFNQLFGNDYTAEDLKEELKLEVEIYPLVRPDHENFNINGLSSNQGGSVANYSGMPQYGVNTFNPNNMNGMPGTGMQNGYPDNSLGGMNGMQNNTGIWDGSAPPQYQDLSNLFEKSEMKQKFFLFLKP